MIHLHTHSHYSVLDGLGKVDHIVARAKEMGAPAVAITDHASISCLADFYKTATEQGIRPIVGCEFYLVDDIEPDKSEKRFHLSVWAKDWQGVRSIMHQLTLANRQFYRRPRLSFDQALEFENCMVATACCFGVLGCDDWEAKAGRLHAAYGQDFYLEIMPHLVDIDGTDLQKRANLRAVKYAMDNGVKLLATNDAHYVNRDDAYTHQILMAIQYKKRVAEGAGYWGDAFYMRDMAQMVAGFRENCPYLRDEHIAQALKTTAEVAANANVKMPDFKIHLPKIHDDDEKAFSDALVAGSYKLKGSDLRAYADRLKYEVSVIREKDFVRYFLIVKDVIDWARSQGIMVGPARGSSAGSLVCYLLDITQIDPIRHGLYFERFLNPERIDYPDIDVDFQDSRRDEVFNYLREKYGMDKTAKINTFSELTIKAAFRDVARAFGVSPLNINLLSSHVEDEESFENVPELAQFAEKNPTIVEQVKKLTGTIRQVGVHACGLIVSSQPLEQVSAIERRRDEVEVINWDKSRCEDFGLLKMDILGLSTLTILNRAKALVMEREGLEDFDFNTIPLDDPKVLGQFSKGHGTCVFQFENSGMQSLLKSLKAADFETITATTALFRPGSLNSGQTDRYVKIACGDEYETYLHPKLEPILGPTKGVMVYQEQIMRIFNEIGGFTWAEADKMRKIIGKKLGKDEFNKHREHFMTGAAENGVNESVAGQLFDGMAEFAAYSFNKSHAVAYTTISFWSMYMKVHHPLEFITAYLDTAQHMSEGKKKVAEAVREAKRLGLEISPPDINLSTEQYEIDEGRIVAPLGIIKGVGNRAVEEILKARKDGVFLSLDEFQDRVYKRVVNKGIVDKLIRAGTFESLGIRESDKVQREKNYAELLPIFDKTPTLDLTAPPLDRDTLAQAYRDMGKCAKEKHRALMTPLAAGGREKGPAVMVVNSPVKGEKKHLTKDGTRHFIDVVTKIGFAPDNFYYTAPVKCFFKTKDDVPKDCKARCLDYLKKEIETVAPKLIICFDGALIPFFITDGGKKPNMAKLHGEVVYNKDFDAYVLFSYSPQYAYYQENKMGDKFLDAMYQLNKIFSSS